MTSGTRSGTPSKSVRLEGTILHLRKKEKYRGVRFHKGAWNAALRFEGKYYYLGRFDTAEDAARAYDKKSVEIYGEHAPTNFEISDYEIPDNIIAKNIPKKLTNEPRVTQKTACCSQIGCGKPVLSRNLCHAHYREWRIINGLQPRTKEKAVHLCEKDGCNSSVYRSRLCMSHWREKFEVEKKKAGRPKQDLGVCSLCEQPARCSSLCKIHYQKYQRRKAKENSLTVDDFVSAFSSYSDTRGVQGKSGEKYITLRNNGRYYVRIKYIEYGNFDTLSEAVSRRDEVLRELA